jgi:hypothetical protein
MNRLPAGSMRGLLLLLATLLSACQAPLGQGELLAGQHAQNQLNWYLL